jgi:hypothetical protein
MFVERRPDAAVSDFYGPYISKLGEREMSKSPTPTLTTTTTTWGDSFAGGGGADGSDGDASEGVPGGDADDAPESPSDDWQDGLPEDGNDDGWRDDDDWEPDSDGSNEESDWNEDLESPPDTPAADPSYFGGWVLDKIFVWGMGKVYKNAYRRFVILSCNDDCKKNKGNGRDLYCTNLVKVLQTGSAKQKADAALIYAKCMQRGGVGAEQCEQICDHIADWALSLEDGDDE